MRISDWSSDVCSSDLEQAGAAELKRQTGPGDEIFGYDADQRQIGSPDHRDAREHEIKIGGGVLARTNTGNEPVLALVIVGGFLWIEDDRDIAAAKAENAPAIEGHVEWLDVRSEERRVGKERGSKLMS